MYLWVVPCINCGPSYLPLREEGKEEGEIEVVVVYAKTRTRFVRNDVRRNESTRSQFVTTTCTETKKLNIVGVDYEKRYVDYSKTVIKSSGLESRVRTVHASVYVVIYHSLTHIEYTYRHVTRKGNIFLQFRTTTKH